MPSIKSNTGDLKSQIINKSGRFGEFGGRYVPELLVPIMDDISKAFEKLKNDKKFLEELHDLYKNFIGRPSPLIFCENLTKKVGGAKIFVKNEGCNLTGAHKINHCVGQILLAKYLGKKRIIAETGAGQHGLATATVCAKFGFECVIYMGAKDYNRQRPNVFQMEMAGAKVISVEQGEKTLRSAVNAALKDLINNSENSYYLLGTACGPHPYPSINVFFQKIIGEEVREQIIEKTGRLPDYLVACVGGGSNSQGLFYDFLDDKNIKMIGVEAGGTSLEDGKHAARFQNKKIGVIEGFKSYFLQDENGQIQNTSSISAGLDYSGVSPQLAYLEDIGRVDMKYATDKEALDSLKVLIKTEGLLPALESSHAISETIKIAKNLDKNKIIICNLSGRGDKDLFITASIFDKNFIPFLEKYIKKNKK